MLPGRGGGQCSGRAGWEQSVLTGPEEPLPGELWGWAGPAPRPPPRNRGAWLEQSQRTEALPTKGPRGIEWAHPWPCLLR